MGSKSILRRPIAVLSGLSIFLGLLVDFQEAVTTLIALLPFLGAVIPIVALGGTTFFGLWFLQICCYWCKERSNQIRQQKIDTAIRTREGVLEMMKILQQRFENNRFRGGYFSNLDNEEEKMHTRLLMRELDKIGLAPPAQTETNQWYSHLSKLIPHVMMYGIERSREEAKSWYNKK